MGDTWITDIQHFLDETGHVPDLPAPARNLVHYLGSIVSATANRPSGSRVSTGVRCRRRPGRKRCRGEILATIEQDSSRIVWACPVCEDQGVISGWEGTLWDSRQTVTERGHRLAGPRISKVTYHRGMVEDLADLKGLETTVLEGSSLLPALVDSVHENRLLELGGEHGYPELGDPVQYDHLAIEHEAGCTEITIYNRAIMLFHTDDDLYIRLHRFCSQIERLRA